MNKILYVLILSTFLLSCERQPQQTDPIPTHESFSIDSKLVNESRIITIWTPPNYKEGKDSLTVLYMLDGGIKEDFPHIANTIALLVANKSIPPIILVGIENTERRRDLTGISEVKEDEEIAPLSDGAANFRAFIKEELFKEIDEKYRTNNRKGIIGESVAGLFVVETFFLNPDMFDIYISMDPSLWWNNANLATTAKDKLTNFPTKEIKFWFAGSSAKDIFTHTKILAKAFESTSPKNVIWKYSDEPGEKHSTIFRATKEKALKWALN